MIVDWKRIRDGEYNEVQAIVNGHTLTVYSDRDGEVWHYMIDDGDSSCRYDSKEKAQREAILEAQQQA